MKCLTETARDNAIAAIKNGIAACYNVPAQNFVHMNISNDGFDFDTGNEGETNIANIIGSTACEIEFQRFCQEQKNDISILHAYPIIKSAFMKFNTLLPSSAPVERLFSFATMFDTAKFNRLTDKNFEKRVLSKANSIFKRTSKK